MSVNYWIFIVIILAVIIIAFIRNEIEANKIKKSSRMDFGTAIDLTGIPVITFRNNGNKFNFILDTGANNSVINSTVLESFVYTKGNKNFKLSGMEGNTKIVPSVNITLNYRDYIFKEEFQVSNLSKVFKNLKESSGVEVSGILGSTFLKKYKYVLDFKELIAYIKK